MPKIKKKLLEFFSNKSNAKTDTSEFSELSTLRPLIDRFSSSKHIKYFSQFSENRRPDKISSYSDVINALLLFLDKKGYIPSKRKWDEFANEKGLPTGDEMCQIANDWWLNIVKKTLYIANKILNENPLLAYDMWLKLVELYYKDKKHAPSVTNLKIWVSVREYDIYLPEDFFRIIRKQFEY